MKSWLFRAIILIVIVGGVWWWFFSGDGDEEKVTLEPEVIEVVRGDMRVVVEATGQVVANTSVEVKSKASGELITLPFEEGDRVEVGQLLLELDPNDERRNVERAESNLRSAQARMIQSQSQLNLMESESVRALATAESNLHQAQVRFETAEALFRRREGLHNEGVLSDEEFEAALTSYEEASVGLQNAQAAYDDAQSYPNSIELRRQDVILSEVSVRNAEIELEEARERYQDTRIISPATGVITDLQVEEGTIIASGISNVGGGTTLMIISDLSRMFIEVEVDETDIGQVLVGQRCEIVADAFPEHRFPGRVEWIAPQGVEETNITSFKVKVEIDMEAMDDEMVALLQTRVAEDADPANQALSAWGLRPNMTARVEIIAADLEDVVLIPNEAIQRGEGNRRFVEVVAGEASTEAEARTTSPRSDSPEHQTASGETRAGRSGPSQRGERSASSGERPSGRMPTGRAPSGRPPTAGSRPTGNGAARPVGGASFNQEMPDSVVIVEGPPTIERDITLGVTDGINTHVVTGLEGGEEILIPIPQWRLEFLRQQAAGETQSDNRRRGMF